MLRSPGGVHFLFADILYQPSVPLLIKDICWLRIVLHSVWHLRLIFETLTANSSRHCWLWCWLVEVNLPELFLPSFIMFIRSICRYNFYAKWSKPFFYAVNVLNRHNKIKLGKRSLTCYKVDTRMDDIQRSRSPKSKMASSYRSRCMCCVLETNLTRKFAADLSLQTFLIHYISR